MDYKKEKFESILTSELTTLYKHIIPIIARKVKRERVLKIYPEPKLPRKQSYVKVYDIPKLPEKESYVKVYEIPDEYYPTSNTLIKHVKDPEYYYTVLNFVVTEMNQLAYTNVNFIEYKNFKDLFAAMGRSAITELYEECFIEDNAEILGYKVAMRFNSRLQEISDYYKIKVAMEVLDYE